MYTRTDIENLYVEIGCCAADKAYRIVQQYNAGTEVCDCELANLSYLVNVRKYLQCYTPVGEIINVGIQSVSNTLIVDEAGPYDRIAIQSSDGSLSYILTGAYATLDVAIRQLVIQINTGTWTAMYWLNPDGDIVFRLISPTGNYNGVTFTITVRLSGSLLFTDIDSGIMTGGQRLATASDLCMSQTNMDTWLNNVIENFREICNGCCDENNTDV